MPLSGQAKAEYMRDYRRRRRNGSAKPATCSFCNEVGSSDRLLVGDRSCAICEECIAKAAARIAEVRGR